MSEKNILFMKAVILMTMFQLVRERKSGIFAMYNPEHKSAKNVLLVRM